MKRRVVVLAGAAVIGLTACSHAAAPKSAPASHGSGAVVVPVSCSQQYHAWHNGAGKGLMDTFHAVSTATTGRDAQAQAAALKQAKPAVTKATRHPIPACADPMGYWSALLMHLNAATAGKGPASSVQASVHDVPKITDKLAAELKQTVK